jgi:N-acetylated-alpha-linked acidic dipeptidase
VNRFSSALICACLLVSSAQSARAQDTAMEQMVLTIPSADREQQDATRINRESHYASTPGDYHIAEWMRDEMAGAGWDAHLETFKHDVPFYGSITLAMGTNAKNPAYLNLDELPIPEDPDGTRKDAGRPFNAWSASGSVYANIIDAGHGLADDYASLAARGLDVRTRILLIRYGREFRGTLAQRAQERGAAGVIFFDDPSDRAGSMHGPAYPAGPYRPLGSIQRGALIEGKITIPTVPVNAITAGHILATMTRNGISDVPFRLTVQMNVKRHVQLWNTVGVLRGRDPTHSVVLGAHRDAWVYGVTDNGSGVSTVLEVARALGYLYRSGWRPQFNIVLVGFDGEEIGEVGSQAYVQMHRAQLEQGCIAYLNADEITTGQVFGASAAAALRDQILPVAERVPDPSEPTRMLYQRWNAQPLGVHVRGPGGGSDFESFLYEIGIPVVELGFYGPFGVYHSGFDDLRYARTQADPGFVNHRAVAQMDALLVMRFASGVVPYRLLPYAGVLRHEIASLGRLPHGRDLTPINNAIARFARRAAAADRRGVNGNVEIVAVRRLDQLVYGRSGYAAIPLPDVASALTGGNEAAISASVGRAVHDLDDISGTIARATSR